MQSDRRANRRPQSESSKVFNPQALHELSDSPYPRFLIVFIQDDNSTCIKFNSWFQSNKSKVSFPIYMIKSTADPAFVSALYRMFNIQGLPAYIVSDKSMKLIDSLIGFNEKVIVSFFKKNFPSETLELS
jgi:hypothetical protein